MFGFCFSCFRRFWPDFGDVIFMVFFFLNMQKPNKLIHKLSIYPRYKQQQKQQAHRNDFELFALSFDMRFLAVVQFMCIGIIYRENDSQVIFYSRWADYFRQLNQTVCIYIYNSGRVFMLKIALSILLLQMPPLRLPLLPPPLSSLALNCPSIGHNLFALCGCLELLASDKSGFGKNCAGLKFGVSFFLSFLSLFTISILFISSKWIVIKYANMHRTLIESSKDIFCWFLLWIRHFEWITTRNTVCRTLLSQSFNVRAYSSGFFPWFQPCFFVPSIVVALCCISHSLFFFPEIDEWVCKTSSVSFIHSFIAFNFFRLFNFIS